MSTSTAVRAKAWLVKEGHLETDGRGRLPLRVIPILEEARKKGIRFSDWPKGNVVEIASKTEPGETVMKVERDPSISNEKVVHELFIRYDLNAFEAVESDGTVHNLRQACICGYSLVGHVCNDPQILVKGKYGHQRVEIRPKR